MNNDEQRIVKHQLIKVTEGHLWHTQGHAN